jgi:hypothetical protein
MEAQQHQLGGLVQGVVSAVPEKELGLVESARAPTDEILNGD